MCAPVDRNGIKQLVYYTKGVGTSVSTRLVGGVFGVGINEILIDAYQWLVQIYKQGDEIFIFGFSRGSFAARSLAGLIAKNGVLPAGSPIGVGELYTRYKSPSARTIYQLYDQRDAGTLGETSILERWLLEYSIRADITMVGVWDTVGALIGPYSFLETGLRAPVKAAYHALAIDEHRKTFRPTLYTQNFHLDRPASQSPPLRDIGKVEQRWFAGAHANVGGGYNSDLLAQIPLEWIKQKAEAHGMEFSVSLNKQDESCEGEVRNSFKEMFYGLYYYATLAVTYYRPIGAEAVTENSVRTVNVNESIDASVFERLRRVDAWRPKNVMEWAARHGVDPLTIQQTVRADNPAVVVP